MRDGRRSMNNFNRKSINRVYRHNDIISHSQSTKKLHNQFVISLLAAK